VYLPRVNLFGPRQVADDEARRQLATLAMELDKLRSALVLLQTEQDTVHTEVRKWMRRAENAERRVRQTAGAETEEVPEVQVNAPSRRRLWGARARIAARRASLAASTNGSGPPAEAEEDDGSDS
jgi:hypothetical protein